MHTGTNNLTIDAANEHYDADEPSNGSMGTIQKNPGGCIFALTLTAAGTGGTETAWGAGSPFPGSNWATYFTYQIGH